MILISIIHHIFSALGEKKDIFIFYSWFEVCPLNNLLCENIFLFFLSTPLSLLFLLSARANLMILHKHSLDNITPTCQPAALCERAHPGNKWALLHTDCSDGWKSSPGPRLCHRWTAGVEEHWDVSLQTLIRKQLIIQDWADGSVITVVVGGVSAFPS